VTAGKTNLIVLFESHATSRDNEIGLASGWFDVDLSTTGEQQARELGARRRDDDLAAVYCSDLIRAIRTAEIAFGERALPILRDARLRECDYGDLTRQPALEIDDRRSTHVSTPFPNGESYEHVVGRVSAWLADAVTTFAGRTVLVIDHRATFFALEHLLRDIPLDQVVTAKWQWQPGWTYSRKEPNRGQHTSGNRRS
jgi:2,3-bisphosphoglycerate-dependent phosphoglycerate mutase